LWNKITHAYIRHYLLGPIDFNTWLRSWKVFKCTCLFLEICELNHWTHTAITSSPSIRNTANIIGSSSSKQIPSLEKERSEVGAFWLGQEGNPQALT
jgi:hypothetical protein